MPELLKKYQCRTIVDAPCGDFYWMKTLKLPVQGYIGIDIVEELIEINQKKYGNDFYSFQHLDITQEQIPQADLVFCRDCLVHLSYQQIFNTIKLLKASGSKYLLTTSFPMRSRNIDIKTESWRPLNLQKSPFNFPRPLAIINEKCTEAEGRFYDKSLILWEIASLPNF